MTEQTSNPTIVDAPEADVIVENPTILQKVTLKYPRLSKVVAIAGGVLAVGGTAVLVTNVKKNGNHVHAAKDHVLEAGHELAESVSPTTEETA